MSSLCTKKNSYQEKILHLQTVLTLCQYHCTITEMELAFSTVLFRIEVKFKLKKIFAFRRLRHVLQIKSVSLKQKIVVDINKIDQIFTKKQLLFKQQAFRIIFLKNQRAKTKKKQKIFRKDETDCFEQVNGNQLKRLKIKYAKLVDALDSLTNQLQRLL